ncbi:hypothetical protein AT251_14480 [Enterovibrio nigricans]|nr:hypothetical protein [Enterovibrio nigricans]PKF50036.1 hypothetical protein AT251_14480 [Enterovibrio nigricans]
MLANESLAYFIDQRLKLHNQGYPCRNIDYLALIEKQMVEIKSVYLSLFRLAPGFVYELKDQSPDVFVWLMLEPEFAASKTHFLAAFTQLEGLKPDLAKMLVIQSRAEQLDSLIASLAEGLPAYSERTFSFLRLRHSISNALTKHWLKEDILSERNAQSALAMSNIEEAKEWLDESVSGEDLLFERLLNKQDRNTWFRQYFGVDNQALPSTNVGLYARLLELKEFMAFDPKGEHAPVELMLIGRFDWVETALEHIFEFDYEEDKAEKWLQALYVIYGERLPLDPTAIGVDYSWEDALDVLNKWVEKNDHWFSEPARLGEKLSFDTTINSLKDPQINAEFRHWLWKQLCIHSRVYVLWDALMPVHQQDWILERLAQLKLASERFELRGRNATLGY